MINVACGQINHVPTNEIFRCNPYATFLEYPSQNEVIES